MGNSFTSLLFKNTDHRVVILGLDNAGKTTILYRIKLHQIVLPQPTVGFNCEKCRVENGIAKGHHFSLWDIGGHHRLRPLWKTYIKSTTAVIYVIDTSCKTRLDESKDELEILINSSGLPISVPILILANKQDLPSSMKSDNVLEEMNVNFNKRIVEWVDVCALTGEGLEDIFGKLLTMINASKVLLSPGKSIRKS
uniref:ADP-ribosylation factor-like protein n=1 Tax=Rhabditophanes sp. KR3021 TaxID=114890 RepID=A0AC35U851_9BILA